jgi:hypothetical protein
LRRSSPDRNVTASLDDQVIPDDTLLREHDNEVTVSILRGLKGQGQEPERLSCEHRAISQLKEILETMPVWEQVLLRCRALEIPYEEISTYTGKPAPILKVYHARVQKKLRKKIEKQFPHFLHSQKT